MNRWIKNILYVLIICFMLSLCGCVTKSNKCTITFDTLGGTEINAQIIDYGGKIEKPIDPVKRGYTFDGWYVSNTDYSDENKWSFIGYSVSDDITLYAKWNVITDIEVNFDLNGGYGTVQNIKVTYDLSYGSLPRAIIKTGYKFIGWFSSLDTNGNEITDNSLVKNENSHTLYAKWEALYSGNGTYDSPYQIDSIMQFKDFAQQVNYGEKYTNKYFDPNIDIDLNGNNWQPIGSGEYGFCGNFNGNGHIVKNFKITQSGNAGLFSNTCGGSISNLGVENFIININAFNSYLCVGGLVGLNMSEIKNCYAIGNITVNAYECTVGGLIGRNTDYNHENHDINNCFAAVDIRAESIGKSTNCYAGGLIGYSANANISNSFACGNVSSTIACSAASYYARPYAGGFVASSSNCNLLSCYHYAEQIVESKVTDIGNREIYELAESCTLEQFNNIAFYSDILNWDNNIWDFSGVDFSNNKYPKLFNQYSF